jgi:hypothetical protein
MGFDYGDPERNKAEAERCREEGRQAAREGKTNFGAGGYKPADMMRAGFWLQGWREVAAPRPELRPAKLRTQYQRMSAAVELATQVRDQTADPAARERAAAIVVLLAAPPGLRKAAEPDVLRMLGREEEPS